MARLIAAPAGRGLLGAAGVLFCATCIGVVACSDPEPPPATPSGGGDTGPAIANADSVDTRGPAPICEPGEVKGCTPDLRGVMTCTEDGLAWVPTDCLDDRGKLSQCYEGECLVCSPLAKRCRDDERVEICLDDGTAWVDGVSCNGAATGQVCEMGSCIALCELSKKWNTYMGCEYWAADLDNGVWNHGGGQVNDAAGRPWAVIVSNPHPKYPMTVAVDDADGPVTVDVDGEPLDLSPLEPFELRVLRVPRRDVSGTVLAPLAYRVSTSIPATVHQFNPLSGEEIYSNDASLLLPVNVLDRWYFNMGREQGGDSNPAFVSVIGTVADTHVTITVSARTLAGDGLPPMEPGESVTRTLNAFDVFNVETGGPGEDLTGTEVKATRRVAVFGGSEAANVPNSGHCDRGAGVCTFDGETPCESNIFCSHFHTCCADHIEQQLIPVRVWGIRYVCARTIPRGDEQEYWRILAAEDNTLIQVVPPIISLPVLHAGEWIEFGTHDDFELSSNHPVLVGQFMAGEYAPNPGSQPGDAGIGDPAFMIAVPVAQYRTEYVVLSPPDYDDDYLNILAASGTTLTLDGVELPPELFEPVGTGDYLLLRQKVDDGVHIVLGDAPFGLMAYGWDSFVSYGYPGGLDLRRLDLIDLPDE